MKKTPFKKPPLSISDQLDLLASRGLVIQDRKMAAHHLTFINYYRFCGYGIEFEGDPIQGEKSYKPGTTFEQILDCYVFDRKLRLLVIDAIERIEIAIRTTMCNTLALKYGSHWYLNRALFLEKFDNNQLIAAIKKETYQNALEGTIQHKKH